MWDALARYRALILVGALLIAPPILLWGQTRAPNARGPVVGLVIEVASWIERPLLALSGLISDGLTVYIGSVSSGTELIELRRDRNGLVAAQNRIRELERENDALRSLAQAAERIDGPRPLGARIIGRTGAPLTRLARIDRGKADGVRRGDGVVNRAGVVGQVLSVGRNTSDVLLMTDPLSALDVVVQRTRARGIIRGSGFEDSYQARVEDFDRLDDVKPGDKLVTSALTSHFPPGMLVGEIREVFSRADSVYRRAEVTPAVGMADLEHVLVLIRRTSERMQQLGSEAREATMERAVAQEPGSQLRVSGRTLQVPIAEWALVDDETQTTDGASANASQANNPPNTAPAASGNPPVSTQITAQTKFDAAEQGSAAKTAESEATNQATRQVVEPANPTGPGANPKTGTDGMDTDDPASETAERAAASEDVSDAFPPYYEEEAPLPGVVRANAAAASAQERETASNPLAERVTGDNPTEILPPAKGATPSQENAGAEEQARAEGIPPTQDDSSGEGRDAPPSDAAPPSSQSSSSEKSTAAEEKPKSDDGAASKNTSDADDPSKADPGSASDEAKQQKDAPPADAAPSEDTPAPAENTPAPQKDRPSEKEQEPSEPESDSAPRGTQGTGADSFGFPQLDQRVVGLHERYSASGAQTDLRAAL